MTQFSFVVGDEKWHQLREKAREDFYWFASVVMGYADLIPMRDLAHRPLCAMLAQKTGIPEVDQKQVQLILQPRELGKSALGRCLCVWLLIKYPDRSILLCSETATLATAILASIKQELLTNDLLRALFPDIIPADERDTTLWRADQINVKRTTRRPDPSLFIAGVDKAITGFHPDDIIVDDMVGREAAENARIGDRSMTETLKGWMRTLVPIQNKQASPPGRMLFIGTRWYMNDPYDYVMEYWGRGAPRETYGLLVRLENGEKHRVELVTCGDVAYMHRAAVEQGRSILPERWTMEKLAQMRVADPSGFAAWMMNNPIDAVTQIFKNDWIQNFDRRAVTVEYLGHDLRRKTCIIDELDILLACDPGGFRREMKGQGRVQPAIVMTGTTPDDIHLVLEAWSDDVTYQVAAKQLIDFLIRYPVRKVVIERAGQQVMFIDLVKKLARDARITVSFEDYKPDARDKAQRILALEPYFQTGRLRVEAGDRQSELRGQIAQFPLGARMDQLDALHMLTRFWRQPGFGTPQMNQRRQQQELQQYYARRGETAPDRG